jgi:Uma2 family endonuclease
MVALRKPAPVYMTLSEFLSWDPEDRTGVRWQLIDGQPVAMAPASRTYTALVSEIGRRLGDQLIEAADRCHVLSERGIIPRIGAEQNFCVPDLGVACGPPVHELRVTDPILLITILSPSNEAEKRSNTWAYETIPAVREILAAYSFRIAVELGRRDPDGNWPETPALLNQGDTLTLTSNGYSVPLAALYGTTALAS